MKRTLVVCLASLLVSGVSDAADRVLVRHEYYYRNNPEIRRVVFQLFNESNRQLGEIDKEFRDLNEKALEKMAEAATGQSTEPDPKFLKRIDDLNQQQGEIRREISTKLFDVLGRGAPYLALECVVAQGSSEEAHAVIHGEPSTYRVRFAGFEGKDALLLETGGMDRNTLLSAPQDPSPFPLNVTRGGQLILQGGEDPVDAAFERASLAPEERATGCTVTQPGGEAPPPVVPRQRSAARVNMFFAPVKQPDQ